MELVEIARFTDDVDACAAFYERLLGAEPTHSFPGGAVFQAAGVELLVHENYEDEAGHPPPEDHPAFAVDDVDAAFEALRDAGLDAELPPDDYDWGRSAYLRDPDGRLVELIAE